MATLLGWTPAKLARGMDVEIEQLRTGDRTAWNRAYEILYAISLGVCCSSAPSLNHHEQEDFAGEAIVEIVEYIEKVSSFEECKKLVVTISKNRLKDHFRKLASQKHGDNKVDSLELHEGYEAPDAAESPDLVATNSERALLLVKALNQVPVQYRVIVDDFYLKQLTQQEIADRRGLKLGSIGVYLSRGLEALKKVLPEDELLL